MNKGFVFAVLTALISGISVFLNGIAVKLSDPIAYTLMKNSGALIFLVAIVFMFREWHRFQHLSRKQIGYLVLIGVIGGSIPFAMFFIGLSMSGAAVSSFIFRSLFLFAGIFGYLMLKENIEPKHVLAGLLILAGNFLLIPEEIVFGAGNLLVLGATALWALEYTVSRKVMQDLHPRVVMVSRMLFGSAALLVFLASTGALAVVALDAELITWLFITSLMLTGFLVTWYTALKHLEVLKATSILATGGIVTAVLNLVFLGKAVSLVDAFALGLILLGAAVMTSIWELFRSNPVPVVR